MDKFRGYSREQVIEDFTRMLYYAADCIRYTERLRKYHDCNDCANRKECRYVPEIGEMTRINCFAWKEKK